MGTEILIGLAISAASSVATSLLAPKQTLLPVDKGRYDDIRVQGSEYGTAISIVYGRARLAGNIIYSDGVQPHVTTTPGRPGGKLGGGSPPEPPVNHYSYTTNIAVAICEGEVKGGLKRMWENAKVTMGTDTNPLPDGSTIEAELTTHTRVGDVQIVRDLAASGEYKVLLNSTNSSIELIGFNVPQLGKYNIKIIYMGLGAKTAEVFVDTTSKGIISFGSTGSDSVSQVKTITHTFTSTGAHTIKIKRDGSNPAPYIDAIGLYGATATAVATVSGGLVTGVTITDGGGGYTVAPLVRFFGAGSGATATATVVNGVVTNIVVNTAGSGYIIAPTVDITPSVVFTPTNVTGLINPDNPYNSNPDYQYQYYNSQLIPDVNGTSSAGLSRAAENYLLYPEDPTNTGGTGGGGSSTTTFGQFTFYSGSETQLTDAYLETLEPGNVPAYRGTCYIVLKNYQIPEGQMPNFTFEVEEGTHNLANILVSLWGRVGLDASLLDVTELDGIFVEGLVINTRTALSDVLEALCIAYAFDFVDLNGKVTAVKRGSTPVATIRESELKAYEDGSEVPVASLEATYVDVKELPKQIDVSYMDRARSYYQNVQPAIKQIGANEEPQTLVLPLVLPAAQAKEIGNRVLNTIYLQKAQYAFTLPPKYSWLSPSDVVKLIMDGNSVSTNSLINYASGSSVSASSTFIPTPNYYTASVIDGNKATPNWNINGVISGNGWHGNSSNISVTPDWFEINFGANKNITQVDVVSIQDVQSSSTPPTLNTTFTLYGLTSYKVQYWNNTSWVDIVNITGNNKVWRQFIFPTVTTNKIRIYMTGSSDGYARLAEVEAWGTPSTVKAIHNLRISQFQTGMPGLCKVQAVPDSASLYLDAEFESITAGGEFPPIVYPSVTQCVFMDIPSLLPEHTGFGFYASACGSGIGNWSGAHLYREEIPNSNSWNRMGSFELPSIIGNAGNALANTSGNTDIGSGRMIDTISSITVSLYNGTLETYNNVDLFNNPNLNLAYIGGELVQFATASNAQIGSSPYVRSYTLTNFRRGLNGTLSKIGGHLAGEEFVLIDSSAQWMRIPAGHLFTDYRYKVVSVGVPLEGVQPRVFNTGIGSAPPAATNLVCNSHEVIAQDGTTQIVIRGTFDFGTFVGGQRAKIFVRRPVAGGGTEATYFNTGIVVVPDAQNKGGFELPAAVQGTYYIQVVTMTPHDLSAPSGHPIANLSVTADTTPPATPSTPVPTFDGQMVTWTWTQSTQPNHSHYKFYTGGGTQIAARIDGNTYTEYPVSGMTRKVTAINRTGVESSFSGIGTFTLTAPNAPTGYIVIFNGVELHHTWVGSAGATPQYLYEISDGIPTVLATSGTTEWVETSPPASRSFIRQVRAKHFGIVSSWTSTTVNIPSPAAPTSVAFNTALATPFEVPVIITPNGSMNERQILRTKVEVMDSTGTSVLQTLYFSGVSRTAMISGRFLNAPNNIIKVRVTYVDFIGDGSSAITPDTYTFPAIGGTDIGNNTITGAHIQNDSITAAHIQNGVLTIAEFAAGIRPVQLYSSSTTSLPALPDSTNYPVGAHLYWTNATDLSDRKLWKSQTVTTEATATTNVSGGVITSITMTGNGSGYDGIPTIRVSGGGGTGAVLTPVMSGGQVISVTVNNGGTGYSSPPTLTFTAWTKRVDATDLVANSVTAGIISAGAISATEIAAGAIRADKMAIGVIQNNLVLNSSFENFTPTPYVAGTSRPIGYAVVENTSGTPDWSVSTTESTEGNYSLRMQGSANFDLGTTVIPVIAGKKYIFRYKYKTAATSGNFGLHLNLLTTTSLSTGNRYLGASGFVAAEVQTRDALDTSLVNFADNIPVFNQVLSSTGGNFVTKQIVWTAGAGVKYINLVFRTNNPNAPVYIDELDVRQEITGVVIEDGTVTANKIVAQSITSTQIQVGSITIDRLTTRVLNDNLILNPGFESFNSGDSKPHNWKVVNGNPASPTWTSSTATTAGDGARSLSLLNTTGSSIDIGCEAIPVAEGEKYYVSFRAKVPTATTGTFAVVYFEYNSTLASGKLFIGDDANGSEIQDYSSFSWFQDAANGVVYDGDVTSTYMTSSWKRFESEYTVPVGVKYITFAVRQVNGTNPIYWDSFVFRKYVPGVTIEDGTITAPKIKAGSITADKLAIGAFGTNLVQNPSFEDFDSSFVSNGWRFAEGSSTSLTSSTDFFADGAYSGKIATGGDVGYSSIAFPVNFGENYAVRLKLRSQASSGTYYIRIFEYNTTLPTGIRYIGNITSGEVITKTSLADLVNIEAGTVESMSGQALSTLNGSFKQKSAIYTPTNSTVKYASLAIHNWGSANAPLYIDDIVIQKKVTGVFIENGTITAENLVIGGMSDNLIANGSFELLTNTHTSFWPDSWYRYNSDDFVSLISSGGRRYIEISDDTSNIGVTSRVIPVVPGSRIAIRFQSGTIAGSGTGTVRFLFRSTMPSTGTYAVRNFIGTGGETDPVLSASEEIISHNFSVNPTQAYYEAVITVPATRYWMSVAVTNGSPSLSIMYDDITVRKQVGQAFISDLRADQIVANVGQIGLIFSDQIRQTNFTSYQNGSIYTGDLGFDYSYGSGGTYDLTSDTLNITTSSSVWNNTSSVATDTWQKIKAGSNGSVEFIVPAVLDANVAFFGGLTANWNPSAYATNNGFWATDYFWYYYGPVFGGSTLFCFEADNNAFSAGLLAAGDVLKISIEEDYVRYRRNGVLIYTSPYRPSVGTIRDGTRNSVTLDTTNASYRGVFGVAAITGTRTVPFKNPKVTQEGIGTGWKLNPLSGTQLYADEPVWDTAYDTGNIVSNIQVGTYLQKHPTTGAGVWDTSAVTAQQITAGDGWFQTTITDMATVGYSFLGLTSNTDWANPAYNPYLTYGFHFYIANNTVQVWENGVNTGVSVPMSLGNVFRVALEGGMIKYLKNNAVFYEHSVTPTYPIRGKVWLFSGSAKLDQLLFTASSSGLGEFNSGITVRGKRIEDIAKLATQSIRSDNRYRGNDLTIPSNIVTSIKYDSYYISWEDNICFINISVTFNDYKTNATKNFDSVKHVRSRVYNKFGQLIRQIEAPYHGRGQVFSGYFPRTAADGKQEAVYSFEFENLYGYSLPIWYSEAGWLDKTTDTWIEAPQNANISYSAPAWFNRNDISTNCAATTLTSTSVQITWTKAVNGSAWNYQVYYRLFKAEGYEGDASSGGWMTAGTTTTNAYKTVTGLQANARYEFMVQGSTVDYGWSNICQARTFLIAPMSAVYGAPSGLAGNAASSTQIDLSWIKNDSANYIETELWRTSSAAGTIPTVPDEGATQVGSSLTGTTYSNTSLTNNTAYSYRARNKYTGPIYSEWSNVIVVTTPVTTPPTPPSNVSAYATGYYAIRINFTGNNGSTNYRTQVAYYADETFSSPVSNESSSGVNGGNIRDVIGLSPGTDYIVRVAKDGTSEWSNTAYVTTYESGGGGGGGYCVLETEPITYVSPTNNIFEVQANKIKEGQMVLGTVAGKKDVTPAYVKKIRPVKVTGLLHITTASGANIKCSLSHKPITGWDDITGVAADTLIVGNSVLVYNKEKNRPIIDIIISIEYIKGEFTVIELSLDSDEHTYIAGGIFAHNLKEF